MKLIQNNRGSSFIFVIVMIILLAIFATGFSLMTQFNLSSTLNNRVALQEENLLKSIHQTVCQEATEGKLEILNQILSQVNTYIKDYNSGVINTEFSEYKAYNATAEKKGDEAIVLSDGSTASIEIRLDCTVNFNQEGNNQIQVKEPSAVITTILTYTPVGETEARTPIQMSAQLQVKEGQIEEEIITPTDPEPTPPSDLFSGDVVFGLLGGFVTNGKTEYREELSVNWGENAREHHLYSFNQFNSGGLRTRGDIYLRAEDGGITLNQSSEIQNVYATNGEIRIYGGVMKGDIFSEKGNVYIDYGDEINNVYALDGDIILNPANNGKVVHGDLYSGGTIQIGNSNQQFTGGIYAQQDITFASLSAKELISGGKIAVTFNNQHVFERVEAKNGIELSGATILGNVISNGDIRLQECEVEGDIITSGTVTLAQVVVKGNVYAEEIIENYNVTIEGDVLKPSALPTGGVPEINVPTVDASIVEKNRPEDYGFHTFSGFKQLSMEDIAIDYSGTITIPTNENTVISLDLSSINEIKEIKVEGENEPIICLNLDKYEGIGDSKSLIFNHLKATNCQLILYSEKDVTVSLIGEIDAQLYLPYSHINIPGNQAADAVTVNGMVFAKSIASNRKTLYAYGNNNKAYQYLFEEGTQLDTYSNSGTVHVGNKTVIQKFPAATLWELVKYYETDEKVSYE